jgi:hypothetical protein
MVVVSPPENSLERPVHAPEPDAGVIEEARARQRRQRRIGGAAVVVAAAVLAVVVASGGGAGSSLTGSAAQPGNQSRAAKSPSFVNASCVWEKTLSGTPARSLLSILGVLRTPAAPLSASVLAQLEQPLDRSNGTEIYTNFIRRARFFEGQPYYIAAIRFDGCVIKPSGDNILLVGDGGGEIGGTAQRIDAGKYVGTGGPGIAGNPHSGTVEMVVPDRVATATIHYPAGPADGFTPKIISPPVTVTATAVGNVLLFNVPRSSGGGQITHPTSMVWRDAAGAIIRTFHGRL